jgi:hypothetical protein
MDPEPIAARHEAVLERLRQLACDDPRVVAAWLQGSRADGSDDAFSDIDFYIAVSDDAHDAFDKLAFVSQAALPLVHTGLPGLNALVCLLEGPVKLDFLVERASTAAAVERPAARMLVNKAGLGLRTGWEPDDAGIARQIDQSLRTTFQGATWPVRLLRRRQWTTHAFSELTLIHSLIVPLMLVQHDRRAFHRNQMTRERLLTADERARVDRVAQEVLSALASHSLSEAYSAHVRIVELMGRVGREACAAYGLEFPEAAEREALRFYEREWPR